MNDGTRETGLGIIVQARMGSSRLPGKILKKLGNGTILGNIFFRLAFLKHPAAIVLATSLSLKDDMVQQFCATKGIRCFRGSEKNVLERYYLCAKENGFKNIVRLTADNPFIDIEELDNLIELHYQKGSDYASSHQALPTGVGAEIFTFDALEKSFVYGNAPKHLEHVNEYILENKGRFNTAVLEVDPEKNRPDIRLTVDTEADYRAACFIVGSAHNEYITVQEAIKLFEDYKNMGCS